MTVHLPWEHEQLVVRRGRRSGIPTMVAIHSTVLGPAVGGCRMKAYPDLAEAERDVLRLSAAMTAKFAAAGLSAGGGKSVIALEPGQRLAADQRRAVLLDHADLVASLGGAYLAGPDVGTGPDDMLVLRETGPHAVCLPESAGGIGSSSGPTAQGVLAALHSASAAVFGSPDMAGRRIVLSGHGSVGGLLAQALATAGAEVLVSDVDPATREVAQRLGYGWVEPEDATGTEADIFVPAAVGGIFDADTEVGARLVVGPANNQLVDDDAAEALAARGVVWVPDYVASAGGVVYALAREIDGVDHASATARVEAIGDVVSGLLSEAFAYGTTPHREAGERVRRRLNAPRRVAV
ncbi:Glu/Leu/Phe/Val dehydrogenase dimerization domain-containing protein [Amycolatopsis jiangsuensis]|uniref:Leucine dehydrogenase n=1 Tax=Amycolatopsis jiangsuensis TaxID=1181879 RepID=A0A840J5P8_9PSEU|nr:Glu/Leu/Phe/Val dehydrogenase dimerization domain-containing protein [Amycolatopsis jiangsuensis]MBB4689360.1 leucine dehydrogenase [Amycolatopsis jiangsuensis]